MRARSVADHMAPAPCLAFLGCGLSLCGGGWVLAASSPIVACKRGGWGRAREGAGVEGVDELAAA
eukprot:13664038-Alexandrium_andersonii.AAC.1